MKYAYKLRFIEELEKLYPDIKWDTMEPNPDVEENFGTGIILRGSRDMRQKEFFIREDDDKHLQWGHIIANYLNGA